MSANSRRRVIRALVFAPLALFPAPLLSAQEPTVPPTTDDAIAFLRWSMGRYASLKSFRANVLVRAVYEGYEDKLPSGERYTIAYAAPNRYRVIRYPDRGMTDFHICDGQNVLTMSRGTGGKAEFARRYPAPVSLTESARKLHHLDSPFYAFLTGPDGILTLLADAEKGGDDTPKLPRFGRDITLNGAVCRTIRYTRKRQYTGVRDIEIAISRKDGLIHQVRTIKPGRPLTGAEKRLIEEYKGQRAMIEQYVGTLPENIEAIPAHVTTETFADIVTDAPIPDSEFSLRFEGAPTFADVGEPAPDITLTALSGGRTVRLSEFQGKVVLLYFWRNIGQNQDDLTGLAEVMRLQREMAARGLEVLAVPFSFGYPRSDEATRNLLKAQRLTDAPVFGSPKLEAQILYGVGSASSPAYAVIGRNGRYIGRLEGAQSPEAVKALLMQAGL